MTIAAAPSAPSAASSHSASPKRRSRARANSSAAANVSGKKVTRMTSAPRGKCEPPPGDASSTVPTVCAASARPSASQPARSSDRRTARSSTAAVAMRTGRPATTRSITSERIGRQRADLTEVDECHHPAMAYDERLASRIRELIQARPGVVEKKMFGGVGWMLGGNMAVGVMSTGGLLVRVRARGGRRGDRPNRTCTRSAAPARSR